MSHQRQHQEFQMSRAALDEVFSLGEESTYD
jgi:hypothetical protein